MEGKVWELGPTTKDLGTVSGVLMFSSLDRTLVTQGYTFVSTCGTVSVLCVTQKANLVSGTITC